MDKKTEKVEKISCPDVASLSIEQYDDLNIWVNEQAYRGRREVTSDREIRIQYPIDHPERHWWITSKSILEDIKPPLRDHADIFDFLLSINLCTDDPIFFSQSPGQVVSGAYKFEDGGLKDYNALSLGNVAKEILWMDEIPEEVEITGEVASIYENVRKYRSKRIASDAEVDMRVALHMFDDALSSNLWTAVANLYYVFENTIFSGKEGSKDELVAAHTHMSLEDAKGWREFVNRIKHPDKGESIEGILDRDELAIPPLMRMRKSANSVLKQTMAELD